MGVDDIAQVMEIEELVFPSPWPAHAYEYELTKNPLSHCFKLEREGEMVGYGCLWLIVDEAHISTLAIVPPLRGRGLGELILLRLIHEAIDLKAMMATLEVRVSNTPAQGLYSKYGFEIAGQRKRYYQDNQEDALIMTVPALDAVYRAKLEALEAALFARLEASGQ